MKKYRVPVVVKAVCVLFLMNSGFPILLAEETKSVAPVSVETSANWVWRKGEPVPSVLPVLKKPMTLAIHVPDFKTSGELIVSPKSQDGPATLRVSVGEVKSQSSLLVEWGTDARPTPLPLSVPLGAISADAPHEVVLRYLGYRVEFFVDGVLVDEEWPMGSLVASQEPLKIAEGAVGRIAIWDRGLSDDELQSLSGGRAGLAEREARYFGPQTPVGQYWRPRGMNTFVGDCMPFFHDGRFHLFYLLDRHHHGSKWHLGAHQWAHISTTDLIHWDEHPMAVPITDEKEGSICTGSTFFYDGTCYAFYAVRTPDGSPAPLYAATSADGIHFTKQPSIAKLSAPYTGDSARDPVVFREEKTGLFHMLLTTSLREPEIANRGGCLAHLVSRDLKQWEQREPFLVPGYPGEPECADYFEWHGWYYLIFSNQGVARYRMSRNPLGPWMRPRVDVFDGSKAIVMKTAAFTGDRRLGAAFLSSGEYAGQVVFREIIQHSDGSLGTKWPSEMVPSTGETRAIAPIKLSAVENLDMASLGPAPKDFLLRARVKPAPDASCFGIRFGAGDKMRDGFELRFEPRREKVGLRDANAGSWDECEDMALYNVTGLDRPFEFEMLVKGDVVDVCVDNRRTLVARLPVKETGLFAFAQNAEVEFESIEVKPLAPPQAK
ncbi:MAG TPA: glycosyl hydrolase [Candidatus Sumerlaeota bacterium]|nr:glycosyl hydrolase [Candidatus Sumerlaeota bacterium]